MSCDEISFRYLEYSLLSSSDCFPVFYFKKNIKVFWENVSVLTEECNHDSVALIMAKVM